MAADSQEPIAGGVRPNDEVAAVQAGMSCWRPALRRCGSAAALASMTLILASCAGESTPGPAGAAGPAAAAADAGQLRITQVRVGNGIPVEGALSYIRIERATGGTLIGRQLPDSGKLSLKLDPGAYRLVSWQRTCDANCGNLDPPSSRCARPFTVRRREPLEATIRVNFASSCVIVLRR
jgi:hypothetical protein